LQTITELQQTISILQTEQQQFIQQKTLSDRRIWSSAPHSLRSFLQQQQNIDPLLSSSSSLSSSASSPLDQTEAEPSIEELQERKIMELLDEIEDLHAKIRAKPRIVASKDSVAEGEGVCLNQLKKTMRQLLNEWDMERSSSKDVVTILEKLVETLNTILNLLSPSLIGPSSHSLLLSLVEMAPASLSIYHEAFEICSQFIHSVESQCQDPPLLPPPSSSSALVSSPSPPVAVAEEEKPSEAQHPPDLIPVKAVKKGSWLSFVPIVGRFV